MKQRKRFLFQKLSGLGIYLSGFGPQLQEGKKKKKKPVKVKSLRSKQGGLQIIEGGPESTGIMNIKVEMIVFGGSEVTT